MRALTTADEQLQTKRGGVTRRVRVSVKDGGGTFRDLTTYLGKDFLLAGSWGETVDDNGFEASFEVLRQEGKTNLSPYMTKSRANLALAYPGSYAPLIEVGREILIEWAIAPRHTPTSALSWVKAMRGHIDSHDPTGGRVRFTARGRYGKVLDTFIEEERVYAHADPSDGDATGGCRMYKEGDGYVVGECLIPGEAKRNNNFYKITAITTGIGGAEGTYTFGGLSVVFGGVTVTHKGITTTTTGTALQTVLQQIVDDNAGGITINTPVSPGWLIKWFSQTRTGVWTALRALVDQIGWDLRDVWHPASSDLRFELRDPNRAKATPDRTFGPGDRFELTRLEKRLDGIRNVIKVWYYDSADLDPGGNPRKKFVVRTDAASVTKYGRRFMEVSEAATSQIDTVSEANAFADAMLSDLAEPNAEQECELPFFPFVELTDLYRFTSDEKHYDANTDLAVVGYRHSFRASTNGSSVRTSLTCRGKPSTGYERWLFMDAGRNAETHKVNVDGKFFTDNRIVTGGPGSAKVKAQETFAKHALPMGIDFHMSKTPGFTPSASTLKQSGFSNQYTMADGDSGDTYYGAHQPWQWNSQKKLYGAKSEEFTVVPGYLEPKHINPERFRGELPPNGSFEGFTREEGQAVPPDNWEMATGTWNTDVGANAFKGIAARDGNMYLGFKSTSVATQVRSKWFPVSENHLFILHALIYRDAGDNDLKISVEWVTAAKGAIQTDDLTVDLGNLTDDAWSRVAKAFLSPLTAAFARVQVKKATAHGDTFGVDGVRLEDTGENWHYAGDTGEPSLTNSWVNFDSSNKPKVGFRRDASGRCWLKGWAKSGTIGAGSPLITLPVAPDRPVRLNAAAHPISRVRAKRTTAQTISTATETRIQFATEDWDALGEHDTSSTVGRFTALYGGYYKISCGVLFTSAAWAASNVVELYIKKNGTREFVSRIACQANFTNYFGTHVEGTVKLAAGDNVTIECYHDRGANTDLHSDGTYNFVTIDRLNEVAIVEIGTDGSVTVLSGDNTLVVLDGLSFAEN